MLRMPFLNHLRTHELVCLLLPLAVPNDQFQTAHYCQVFGRFATIFPEIQLAVYRPNSMCGATFPAVISSVELPMDCEP